MLVSIKPRLSPHCGILCIGSSGLHFAFRNVRGGAGHRGHLDDEHARFVDVFAVSDLNSRLPALLPLYSAGRGIGRHG